MTETENLTPGLVASRVFTAQKSSTGEARRWMGAVLDGHPRRDDAVLLLSEAFANAVVHTRSTEIGVTVAPGADGAVTVQVVDQGAATVPLACRCSRDEYAESGRGIGMIRSQAARWGFAEERTGGVLWFELGPERF